MTELSREFGVSVSTIHNAIETIRTQLRSESVDLAAQEREHSLALLDTAISSIIPHILGLDVEIETSSKAGTDRSLSLSSTMRLA